MWVRELLNDRKWHRHDLDKIDVLVRHRGAEGDERNIFGVDIREIRPGGLVIAADPATYGEDCEAVTDGTVFIPYHRVLRVSGPEGILWTRE